MRESLVGPGGEQHTRSMGGGLGAGPRESDMEQDPGLTGLESSLYRDKLRVTSVRPGVCLLQTVSARCSGLGLQGSRQPSAGICYLRDN